VQASIVSFLPDGRRLVATKPGNSWFTTPTTPSSPPKTDRTGISSMRCMTSKKKCPTTMSKAQNNSVLTQIHDRTYTIPEIGSFVLKQMKSIAEITLVKL
jgi:molecular chaperone DnaK (HSP70)